MMNSYLVDILIREQIVEARRRAATHALLHGISRPSFADGVRRVMSRLARRSPRLTQHRPLVQGFRAGARPGVAR
jgi:hypothetical protein